MCHTDFIRRSRYDLTSDLQTCAGGPLSEKSGNKLVAGGVNLYAMYGATEFGVHSEMLIPDVKSRAEWAWICLPDWMRCRWVPEGDGTYELHLLVCHSTTSHE